MAAASEFMFRKGRLTRLTKQGLCCRLLCAFRGQSQPAVALTHVAVPQIIVHLHARQNSNQGLTSATVRPASSA